MENTQSGGDRYLSERTQWWRAVDLKRRAKRSGIWLSTERWRHLRGGISISYLKCEGGLVGLGSLKRSQPGAP